MEASSSNPPNMIYEVFINFRGKDVRNTLLGHLCQTLRNYGLMTIFVDNEELKIGNRLDERLERSIEESRTAIVILSQNYATSKWPLRELAKIMESMDNGRTDRVFPVFYHVDPHDVRRLSGSFKESFEKYDEDKNFTKEEVQRWRNAMTNVGYLAGEVINTDSSEVEGCNRITNQIFARLRRPMLVHPNKLKYLVDIPNRVNDINRLLALESNDKRFIGIVGMGGIGKTTLAQVLCKNIASKFDDSPCFITIPKCDKYRKTHYLIEVQCLLLSRLLKKEITTNNILEKSGGANLIKVCLKDRKVLIVLDGVNEKEELEYLVGGLDWFGSGSRIIITTKNKDVFPHPNHQVRVQLYTVQPLDKENSFSLFWKHAFEQSGGSNEQHFIKLSKDIEEKVEGNPQALEQIGSFLRGKSIDVWKEELERLVLVDNERLFKKLKLSYDQLEAKSQQDAFLDLACFFNGKSRSKIIEIFRSLEYQPLKVLRLLCDRYLIEIKNMDTIYVPNLIQEMGREIERKEPKRSRIWLRKDAFDIFPQQHRIQYINGVVLDKREKQPELELKARQLKEMNNLKILEVDNVKLLPMNQLDDLSNQLRLLNWYGYPSTSLPLNFEAPYLLELHLPNAQTTHLWKGQKKFENLKVIDARDSRNLVETPNFDKVPNLERLILINCSRLKRIDNSIIRLKHLRLVDLTCCFSLETSSLECIETLMRNLPNMELRGFRIDRSQSSLEGVARQHEPPRQPEPPKQPEPPRCTPKSQSFTSRIKRMFK